MADTLDEAERLFAEGEELGDADQDTEALVSFQAAWAALPEPKEDQEPAIQILAAIADYCFFLGDWDGCRDAVQRAFRCGAEMDNPFFRLRLGQSLYELGDKEEATNWLVPLYLEEGLRPFRNEDPKYLDYFRGRLQPPPGGWPEGW